MIKELPKLIPRKHPTRYNDAVSFTLRYKPDYIVKINTEIYPSHKYREGVYNIYYQYLLLNKNKENEYEIDDVGIIRADAVIDMDYKQYSFNKERKFQELDSRYRAISEHDFVEKLRSLKGDIVVVNNRMSLNDMYLMKLITDEIAISDIATCFSEPPTEHGFMSEIYDEGPHHSIQVNSIEVRLHGTTMVDYDVKFNDFYYKGVFIEGEGSVPMKDIAIGNIDKNVKNIVLNSLHICIYKTASGLCIYLFIWNEEVSNITSIHTTFSNIYNTTLITNIAYISEELLKLANKRRTRKIYYKDFESEFIKNKK
jgi:hypothetical protein